MEEAQPSAPTPPPQPPPTRSSHGVRDLLIVTAMIGVLIGFGGWFFRKGRQLARQQAALEQRNLVTAQQLQTLQQQHDDLVRRYDQVMVDRDNLLAQTKRTMAEQTQLTDDRTLFEGVLKRVSQEDHLLRETVGSLKTDYRRLQELADGLMTERNALQDQVGKLKNHEQERRFKDQLAKEQEKHRRTAAQLAKVQQEGNALKAKLAKLEPLQNRLSLLQEKYAALLAEQRTLRHFADHVPKDVTAMAREHERLLREVADTHYNMGVLFSAKNDYVRAEKEFAKVVELQPGDADAYYNLGVIYAERLPDRQKAMTSFRKYLQLKPHAKDASWVKQYIASWQAWEGKERLE